ncbi:hypothetical protein CN126_14650 [Sinorhizobium meliloti]|uniref:hypothetical protein n=1 Tax=Rhizobium meliloti TaxID=382 RepID=UPI000FDA7034|nr:hypothetical protein [Sinorhizobium meliloti]RVK59138.1 hypothetical protein CN162_07535 [Sinorhizobium meliloti]RVM76246.1 hypothetical protein CN126_14650 [Sinorhizobium meliloti]RVM95342.1 hypothetical protein CN122_06690 [Sinorhizobium meliloti]RVN74692.1 hypothetical protein CN110_08975 [Sinorhizobium meliloti]
MAVDKDKAQRRVYVLPTELVDRIVAYQQEMGIQSEVEAVRRLLDEALMTRDDWRSITRRFKEKLAETRVLSDIAKDVLVGHPLVNFVGFESNLVRFNLSTGETVEITSRGEVTAKEEYGNPIEYEPKSGGNFSRDLDDDIPF